MPSKKKQISNAERRLVAARKALRAQRPNDAGAEAEYHEAVKHYHKVTGKTLNLKAKYHRPA